VDFGCPQVLQSTIGRVLAQIGEFHSISIAHSQNSLVVASRKKLCREYQIPDEIVFILVCIFSQILSLIGENYDDGDDVCGCVVSVRKAQDKLALWVANADNSDAVLRIGFVTPISLFCFVLFFFELLGWFVEEKKLVSRRFYLEL
jgi:hypothetical protein